MQPNTPLETLRVEAPTHDHEIIEQAFAALPTTGYACWTAVDTDRDQYEAYFEDPDDADRAFNALNMQRLAANNPQDWTLTRASLAQADWAHAWRAHFKIEKISPRLVVCPDWEHYAPLGGEHVIRIDPGMSFGTGRHETTRSCLQMLDAWTKEGNKGSFLDLGCGSGILAIAAAMLGLDPVDALDYDPDAVQGACENIERNQLANRIQPAAGDVANLNLPQSYSIVAANILAPVLMEHASSIAATVEAAGVLILSGILTTQYPEVQRTYQNIGFIPQNTITDGEWTSGLFRRENT